MKELNLIPYELKEKRDKEISVFKTIMYISIVIIILFPLFYIPNYVLNSYKLKESQLKSKISANAGINIEKENLSSEIKKYKDINAKIDSIKNQKIISSNRIRGIQKSIPTDITLSQLTYNKNSIVINGFTGNYNSISEFVANLQQTDDYKNSRISNIASVIKIGDKTLYNFTININ